MGLPAQKLAMTAAEFLAWDATQTVRHEFVRGEVFAMAGATEAHVTVALNVAMSLRQQLAGTPCRTFITDMKLLVEATGNFYYPDVMVTCSAKDATDSLVKREPTLLVEVLSPSTAAYDRGEKFAAYRRLPTLREYLLVDLETRQCDLYRKNDEGRWVLYPWEPAQDVELASFGLRLTAVALWAEVPVVESAAPPAV